MSDVYSVWEDAMAEKSLVMRRDSNPQYAYVANYPWLFFTDEKKLHILAYFEEVPEIECRVQVKIWFKNEEFRFYERQEEFPFSQEEGDTYEIEDPNWVSIEIVFRVVKLHGQEYTGPPEQLGPEKIVIVGEKRILVDMKTMSQESEVFRELFNHSPNSEITIFDMDPEAFLELLRVTSPPFKRISRYNFPDLVVLAARFRMRSLLNRIEEFTKTNDYDKKWMTRHSIKRIEEILNEDPLADIQTLDEFRVKKRQERPLKTVRIMNPEVGAVFILPNDDSFEMESCSCLARFSNYCSAHKTRIIFMLLSLLFFENLMLLVWFLSIYRVQN